MIINGKFLSVPMTGVHRVAQELANAIAELDGDRAGGTIEVWHPYDGAARATAIRLPCRTVGPGRGIPWEQFILPSKARGRLLLNLCNIAPVAATNSITMIHDAQVYLTPESYSRAFTAWYRLVLPFIARRHRHLLTVSEYSKQQLVRLGLAPPDKISVIHNGADHILAAPSERAILGKLDLRERSYAIGFLSSQPHKNVHLLLKAFSLPSMSELKLVLIGTASPSALDAVAPFRRENIILSGGVTDGELRQLYEGALCIAFPSTTEGFGLPPMEAMHLGCPAVVAPCGALPEVCGDAAIYADPKSPEAWANALLALSRDSDMWRYHAQRAQAHASTFTWRRAAERLVTIVRRVRGEDGRADRGFERAAA